MLSKKLKRYFKKNRRELISIALNIVFLYNSFAPVISYAYAAAESAPETSMSAELSTEDTVDVASDEQTPLTDELVADPVADLNEAEETNLPVQEEVAAPVDGTVCLDDKQEVVSSTQDMWSVDGDTAKTKDAVELGVEYVYPLNDSVKVTFTCLPANEDLRTALEITQVKVSDLKLPDSYTTTAEYAFDIDTDMEKGTFEYNLELPGSGESSTADVVYIEKDISDVTNNKVSENDLKQLSNEKRDGEKIKVDGLDHFTIFIPTIDVDGANDEPGQKDLTKFAFEQTGPKTYEAYFSWDDQSTTNTIDACILFNTDGDSGVNYAVCPKYTSAGVTSFTMYSCSDRLDKPSNCWDATVLPASNSVFTTNTSCSVNVTNDDPFSNASPNGPGDDYPNDLTASCTIELQPSFPSQLDVTNVCTYPSGRPTSDASDCIGYQSGGFLQLIKVANPDDATPFNFTVTDGADFSQNVQILGSGESNLISVPTGKYSITESVPNGWQLDNATCTAGTPQSITNGVGDVDVATGATVICTFNDSLSAGTITVTKVVTNNNGGTAQVSDFPLFVGQTQVTSGVQTEFEAGNYVISETNQTGYAASFSGDCDQNGNLTLAAGQDATCTITNDDIAPLLTVTKVVTNNNGGTAQVSDFPLFVGQTQVTSGDQNSFSAGNYVVSETGQDAYAASFSGACDENGNITLNVGDVKSCTITNDDKAATLTVIKLVSNDDGGNLQPSDFTINVDGTNVSQASFAGSSLGTVLTLDGGAYTVSEDLVAGYIPVYSQDCEGTILAGESKVCTITNGDVAPSLTIVKQVINDDGGVAVADDFSLYIGNIQVQSGAATYLAANTQYTAHEDAAYGYAASDWSGDCAADGTVTLLPGDNKVCYITNDDVAPRLTVTKVVTNDNGGTAQVNDFPLFVDQTQVVSGEQNEFFAGNYVISETGQSGYAGSFRGDCDSKGNITLNVGDVKTCTITNNDQPASLTLVKYVTNDNGGTAQVSDFPLFINGNAVVSGQANSVNAGILYTATETNQDGYLPGPWGGDCAVDGTITLVPGQVATCTITNNDIQPLLTVTKVVNGGSAVVADFPLFVDQTSVTSGVQAGFDAKTYVVSETNQSGYTAAITGDCDANGNVTLEVGDVKSCTITNTRDTGTLTVLKQFDSNNDGVFEGSSSAANTLGFRWGLDGGDNTRQFATSVAGLETGSHSLTENLDTITNYNFVGYVLGRGGSCANYTPAELPLSVEVLKNTTTAVTLCNVINTGTLTVHKLYDSNDDGTYDVSDDGANELGFRWGLDDETPATLFGTEVDLPLGTYTISEGNEEFQQYKMSGYSLNGSCNPSDQLVRVDGPFEIEITGEHLEITICNHRIYGGIFGYKWNDLNADGIKQENEPYLSGWTIFLDENENQQLDEGERYTTTSDGQDFGRYVFDKLSFGTYYVCEVLQDGWLQSYPQEPSCHTVVISYETGESDGSYTYRTPFNFGNYVGDPVIEIEKFNNTSGNDKNLGDTVTYTITVSVLENGAKDVTVTDLLPDGFGYTSGSWTANSSVRGDLKLANITTEPTYHSPGTWTLGDMSAGEIVTLTYTAKIGAIDAGLYKDLAYALGENTIGSSILGLAQPTGYVDENYVGTEVNVVVPQVEDKAKVEKNEVTEEVLGASTERLPATGAATVLLYAALGMVVAGIALVLFSLFKKNSKAALVLVAMLVLTGNVYAASLQVQIEEPDATANKSFDITFVALDIQNRSVIAKCMVKTPGSVSYAQFGSDIDLGAGGDSGVCAVGSGVLSVAGNYDFRVDVSAGADSASSEVVSVDYNGSAPERPKYIKKDKQNSCEYDIEVKTHADGGTSYIEVYRSDNKEFTVNDASRIRTIAVGPDQKVEFTDTVSGSDCAHTQYYATRAFNSFGNPSDVRTEEIDDVTTVTVENSSSSEQEAGAIATNGGSILGDNSDTNQSGSNTGNDASGTGGPTGSDGNNGDVLGDSSSATNWWIWLLLGLLGILGFGAYSRRKNK